jgi:hypothetical protein
MNMTKNACHVLLIACSFLLFSGKVCLAQRAPGIQATARVQQLNLLELKNMGMMIAKGEPQEKYLAVWKQLVGRSKNMDVGKAVNIVIDEAKQENNRNVDLYRSKVQKYDVIKKNISQEISVNRLILNRSADRIQSIQENIYIIERRIPDKFIVRKGNIINMRSELENYINYLQRILNEVGDDAQSANIDLQNIYQNQSMFVSMLSSIYKALEDSAMAIIKNME